MRQFVKRWRHFVWLFRKNYRAEIAGPYPYPETSTMGR
jgi:hypothetical protein